MLKMRNPNSVKLCTILSNPAAARRTLSRITAALKFLMSSLSATVSTMTKNIAICRMSVSPAGSVFRKARAGVKSSGLAPDFLGVDFFAAQTSFQRHPAGCRAHGRWYCFFVKSLSPLVAASASKHVNYS